MLSIAGDYVLDYGPNAVATFVTDLMRDDPAQFKRGFSMENAIIAASSAFNITTDEVRRQISVN